MGKFTLLCKYNAFVSITFSYYWFFQYKMYFFSFGHNCRRKCWNWSRFRQNSTFINIFICNTDNEFAGNEYRQRINSRIVPNKFKVIEINIPNLSLVGAWSFGALKYLLIFFQSDGRVYHINDWTFGKCYKCECSWYSIGQSLWIGIWFSRIIPIWQVFSTLIFSQIVILIFNTQLFNYSLFHSIIFHTKYSE